MLTTYVPLTYLSPIVIVCPALAILVSTTLPAISLTISFTGSFRSLLAKTIRKLVLLGFGMATVLRFLVSSSFSFAGVCVISDLAPSVRVAQEGNVLNVMASEFGVHEFPHLARICHI